MCGLPVLRKWSGLRHVPMEEREKAIFVNTEGVNTTDVGTCILSGILNLGVCRAQWREAVVSAPCQSGNDKAGPHIGVKHAVVGHRLDLNAVCEHGGV